MKTNIQVERNGLMMRLCYTEVLHKLPVMTPTRAETLLNQPEGRLLPEYKKLSLEVKKMENDKKDIIGKEAPDVCQDCEEAVGCIDPCNYPVNVEREMWKAYHKEQQPKCPFCGEPLNIEFIYWVKWKWQWDSNAKKYVKRQLGKWSIKPRCVSCLTNSWGFAHIAMG